MPFPLRLELVDRLRARRERTGPIGLVAWWSFFYECLGLWNRQRDVLLFAIKNFDRCASASLDVTLLASPITTDHRYQAVQRLGHSLPHSRARFLGILHFGTFYW